MDNYCEPIINLIKTFEPIQIHYKKLIEKQFFATIALVFDSNLIY
jgi:hypothetical protein